MHLGHLVLAFLLLAGGASGMHLGGMVFQFIYDLVKKDPSYENLVTPVQEANTHFQLSAKFHNWNTELNANNMFSYALTHKAEVGYPGVNTELLVDDYYGPIYNKNAFTWVYGKHGLQILNQTGRTAFVPEDSQFYKTVSCPFSTFKQAFTCLANQPSLALDVVDKTADNTTVLLANKTLNPQESLLIVDLLKLQTTPKDFEGWTGLDEITVPQTFVTLNAMDEDQDKQADFFKTLPVDGALNLGMWDDANTSKSFVETVLEKVQEPVLTYWVEPKNSLNTMKGQKAIFTFGSKDPEHCKDDWFYTPRVEEPNSKNGWAFQITSLHLNDTIHADNIKDYHYKGMDKFPHMDKNKPSTAVLAKTSYWTSGPQDQVEYIAEKLGAVQRHGDSFKNRFVVECIKVADSSVFITFGVGDNAITLGPEDYLIKQHEDENWCALIFTVNHQKNDTPGWILGAPFLNKRCASLNTKTNQIGFASAK